MTESNWMTRRQEALETGLDALKRMTTCKTPVEMVTIYSEWLSGSMTRVLADFEDAQKAASQMLTAAAPAAPVKAPVPHQLREAA